jgi:hypothetical protein
MSALFDVTYSQSSLFNRLKATLPNRWFGDNTPVLDAVLNALSAGWVGLFGLLSYTITQTRVSTATDSWLDLIARDYFGYRVRRRAQEIDGSFRGRILEELLRDRCTRAAVSDLLLDLTGRAPIIFEPGNPEDTGCYGSSTSLQAGAVGYGISGGWGSLNLPFQAFVRAVRPETVGVAMVNGWNGTLGGFGTGRSSYIAAGTNSSQVSESEIYENVSRVAPAGTIIWMSIAP